MKNKWWHISDKELDVLFRKELKRSQNYFDETSWIRMKIKMHNHAYIQQQMIQI